MFLSRPPDHLPTTCYQIFIRSFCDSNNDKIGDLQGIIAKLDYLKDLGIKAIWITSLHPSPSYHKYDVTNYYDVDPEYGSLEDYKQLIHEAHQRGILIYHDLIINHTSEEHAWFLQAKADRSSPYRSYYRWMTQQEIDEAGVAHREQTDDSGEANPWHDNPGDDEKYYGLFTKEMPDLNFDTPKVREEVYTIARYWLKEIGVDGLRLDAARHIYPVWEKEKNPEFWQEFGAVVKECNPEAYTVGEVWAHAEEVAPYFRGLDASFHFDFSFAIQDVLEQEKDNDLVKKLKADYEIFASYKPDFVDATMLTNHDQIRIGTVVNGDVRKMKLAASLLLTLPGQPYIYYGEEIGMLGPKPDPRIREAFLWTNNPDDPNLANWQPSVFSIYSSVTDLESQQKDPDSLFNHYKQLIHLRNQLPALGQILHPNLLEVDFQDSALLCYLRTHDEQPVLVLNNLTADEKRIELPEHLQDFSTIYFQNEKKTKKEDNSVQLSGFSTIILGKK